MEYINTTTNPIVPVPVSWDDLIGDPANSPALVDFVTGTTPTLVGVGGTDVTFSGNTWYIETIPPTGTTAYWGWIDGDISSQTDLQEALAEKSNTGHTHTMSEVTDLPTLGTMAEKTFWSGTEAQYNAIGVKDANTIYFITV